MSFKRSSALQSHPYVPQLTHSLADTLESWRQEHLALPVLTWKAFHEKVRSAVNPLVSDDQLRDITNSLHKMGEVGVVVMIAGRYVIVSLEHSERCEALCPSAQAAVSVYLG